jgi:subtilisin family serine protease
VTKEGYWYSGLERTAAAEAEIIVDAFRERGIEIVGEADPAREDADVKEDGIAFMCDRDHILTREQYLGGAGTKDESQRTQDAGKVRGVLDVLQGAGVPYPRITRVAGNVVLLCLNRRHPDHTDLKESSNDPDAAREESSGSESGAGEPTTSEPTAGEPTASEPAGGDGGEADRATDEGERHDALELLDLIDRELGVGIATPDQVLTAANGAMGPCSASEPQPIYPPAGPNPPVCREGGARVRVFVADTGLLHDAAATFPWLDGVQGEDDPRTHLDGTIRSYGGHGTFVAGVLRSMAPEAQVHVADIFNIAGSALESHFVRRLNEAFDFGFEILHLTASCMTRKNVQLIALETWLKLLGSYKGVVCVTPAGNNHTRRPSWPGAFPGVISVGALATDWRHRAYFSDYGAWVDVYAPGEKLINAFGVGKYTCKIPPNKGQVRTFTGLAQWSGTSFSAPIVTGLIAARMVRHSESAEEAAAALLAEARAQAIPEVGPVLFPGCAGGEEGRGHRDDDRRRWAPLWRQVRARVRR